MARTFSLERVPFASSCSYTVSAEWQTGYFDILQGCVAPGESMHFDWKGFKKHVPEETTEEGHPLLEVTKNARVVLCAPQLFLRWAHLAGVPPAAATALSDRLLAAHSRHLAELDVARFYELDRLAWLKSRTIESGDLAHYEALSNWTKNARTSEGQVTAFCSIPVKKEASTDVEWLLSALIKPAVREEFCKHVRGSGLLLWEELEHDAHHFYNVRCEDMMSLVSSYSKVGALSLQASLYNAKMLEASNLGLYPPAPQERCLQPFPVVPPEEDVMGLLKRRPDPFPVDWKTAFKFVGGQNAWQFRSSFLRRVRANCADAEYIVQSKEDGEEARLTVSGLRSLCRSCKEPKRSKLLSMF